VRPVPPELIERLIRAWNDAGPFPKYHQEAKRNLRIEWPALAEAIDAIDREADRA